MRTLTTMIAAALLAPAAAYAGVATMKVGQPAEVQLTEPGAETWRVYLHGDHDYALATDVPGLGSAKLRDARGRTLTSVPLSQDDETEGAEFRTSYAGNYFVTVRVTDTQGGTSVGQIRVDQDCRKDGETRCGLSVGGTVPGRFSFAGDADAYRTSVQTGQGYVLGIGGEAATNGSDCAEVRALDAGGAVIKDWSAPPLAFVAPTSTVLVESGNGCDFTMGYDVSLLAARQDGH